MKVTDEQIIECFKRGLNQNETAEELGVSDKTISYKVKDMRRRGINIPKIRLMKIDYEILEGLRNHEKKYKIAERLGITNTTLSARIKRMRELGVEIPGKDSKMEKGKELDEIDIYILELLGRGKNKSECAKEIKKSPSVVTHRMDKMEKNGIKIPDYMEIRRRNKELDELDQKILKLIEEKQATQAQIAEELGLPRSTIMYHVLKLKNMGIDKSALRRKIQKHFDTYDNEILLELNKGSSRETVAEKLGIKKSVVDYRIKVMEEAGIEIPNIYYVRKQNTELSLYEKKILECLEAGETQTQIAEKFETSQAYISTKIKKMRERGIEIPDNKVKRGRQMKRIQRSKINKGMFIEELLKLKDTKNASMEQIIVLAKYYGVDLYKELELQKFEEQNER